MIMKVKAAKIPAFPAWMFPLTFRNFIIVLFYKWKLKRIYVPKHPPRRPLLRNAAKKRGIYLGAAVNDMETPEVGKAVIDNFTSITPENDLKWGNIRKSMLVPYDFSRADRIVDTALKHGMRVRGHALVWGKYPGIGFPSDLPDVLNNSRRPKAELRKIFEEHIFTVMEYYKDRISDWDVLNEPFELFGTRTDGNIFYQVLGAEYMELSLSLARQANPLARIFINEDIHHYADNRAKKFLTMIGELRNKNVPFDAVGLQSHIITSLTSMKELKRYLDSLAELGLDIEITELDASIGLFRKQKDPYKAQGELFKAVIETCLECPACKGITFWGVNDKNNWMDVIPFLMPFKPNSPVLFDQDTRPKPAYYAVLKALTG